MPRLPGKHPLRLELFRSQGDVVAMGSHVFVYESDEQMRRMIELLQGFGISIANSHTTGVREVGIKQFTADDLPFKQRMDPYGLFNPGKLDFDEAVAKNLPTTGWSFEVSQAIIKAESCDTRDCSAPPLRDRDRARCGAGSRR